MKRITCLFIVLIGLSSCTSVEKYNQHIISNHTVASLHKDVDKAYQQLKKHHPNLYLYSSKEILDAKFDSLKKTITEPITSKQFYNKLAPVVKSVRQGHLNVFSVNRSFKKKDRKAINKKEFGFNKLDFEYLENKLLVIHTRSKDSNLVGSEVLKIGNESVNDLILKYKSQIASDGFNTTFHDCVIGNRFKSIYYNDKGFQDSLQVTFKKNDSVFNKTFKRVAKEIEEEVVKRSEKDTIVRRRLTKAEKKLLKQKAKLLRKHHQRYGYNKSTKEYTRNIEFIGEDNAIAYMKIRGFMGGKYEEFYEEVFQKIDSSKTQNLIIDLRNNGGGSLSEISELYSYLTDEPFTFVEEGLVNSRVPLLKGLMANSNSVGTKLLVGVVSPGLVVHNLIKTKKKDGKLYYRFKESKMKLSKANSFSGNVYVLINGLSFSASSILSNQLQANNRAVFVGNETGGAYNSTVAGRFKVYTLPTSKLKMRIGLMQLETQNKQEPDGYGVKPNHIILPTIKDRIQKKDPELNWILNDIENTKE